MALGAVGSASATGVAPDGFFEQPATMQTARIPASQKNRRLTGDVKGRKDIAQARKAPAVPSTRNFAPHGCGGIAAGSPMALRACRVPLAALIGQGEDLLIARKSEVHAGHHFHRKLPRLFQSFPIRPSHMRKYDSPDVTSLQIAEHVLALEMCEFTDQQIERLRHQW